MKKNLQNYFLTVSVISVRLFLTATLLCLLPKQIWSQKRQLSPSAKVSKIAFIDQSRLRKDYKAFSNAKEKIAKDNEFDNKAFDRDLKLLEEQTKNQLRLDSLSGGANHTNIINQATAKRNEIVNNHQLNQKKRNQERIALMQDFERKIVLAIEATVSEGGFTDVQALGKEPPVQRGINVTDLILKKLN